jgi:hypothetical protein
MTVARRPWLEPVAMRSRDLAAPGGPRGARRRAQRRRRDGPGGCLRAGRGSSWRGRCAWARGPAAWPVRRRALPAPDGGRAYMRISGQNSSACCQGWQQILPTPANPLPTAANLGPTCREPTHLRDQVDQGQGSRAGEGRRTRSPWRNHWFLGPLRLRNAERHQSAELPIDPPRTTRPPSMGPTGFVWFAAS